MERIPCPICKIHVDFILHLQEKSKAYHVTAYALIDCMRKHLSNGLGPIIEVYKDNIQKVIAIKNDEIEDLMTHFDKVESNDIWGPQYYHYDHLNNRLD